MASNRSSALLLLPLLFAVAAAGSKPSISNFQAHLFGAGTAGADEYYKEGHDVVELVEQRVTNCRYFGCQNWVDTCPQGGGDTVCAPCQIGNSWTSQFTCRKDSYGYKGEDTINFGQQLGQATGECYWDVLWYRQDNNNAPVDNTGCGWIPVDSQTARIGSATGRCYFPGGDDCSEPLCSTLRVTVTAEVYATDGYTRTPTANNFNDATLACVAGGSAAWNNGGNCNFAAARLFDRQSASKVDGNKKAADNAKAGTASVNYEYNHQTENYYPAFAMVISGSITSINGQKYVKEGRYTDGSIQYVPYVLVHSNTPVTSVPASAAIVTPQAYTIEFVKDGARYYSK